MRFTKENGYKTKNTEKEKYNCNVILELISMTRFGFKINLKVKWRIYFN